MKIQTPTLTNMQKTTSPLKLVIKEIYMINSLTTLSLMWQPCQVIANFQLRMRWKITEHKSSLT